MFSTAETNPPEIEERFLTPKGWRWHAFKNPRGYKIRFGSVAPESGIPDAVVIVLQGLSEYTEKYFELANDLLSRNLSFWMIDWQGQGASDRHLEDRQKRHSSGFQDDINDLHYFIMEYVKHSAVHPDVGRIPLVMLGHSMGANIGMRYLHDYPDMFACAAFTSPMFGIGALKNLPRWLSYGLVGCMQEAFDRSYVEFGGKEWNAAMRDAPKKDIFSSDEARKKIHNLWMEHDPQLQVGNVTYGWLYEAVASCNRLHKKGYVERIETPTLFAIPGHEKLVDNKAARKVIKRMPNATTLELPDAKHEILMETDEIRNAFLNEFMELLATNNIKEKLKPF
ncbi:MAG TPA: alpha/beta hydrolase [Micavibrio sp.]|nr:alpha/beta hydrolase [Micavibrio sp.]